MSQIKRRALWLLISAFLGLQALHAKIFVVEDAPLAKSSSQVEVNLEKQNSFWKLSLGIKSFEGHMEKRLPLRNSLYKLEVPGLKLSQKPGHPQLPYKSFLVAGHPDDLDLEVTVIGEKTFNDLKALPAPLKSCRCLKDLSFGTESYPINENSYFQEDSEVVELKYLGDYRGQPITKVVVRPMIQKGNQLKVFKGLEVNLKSRQNLEVDAFTAQSQTMVLVTPRKLQSGAENFKAFKEGQGFTVDLYTFEDVATDANSLKTFLHQLYASQGYQYAVLFGHEGILPPLKVATSSDPQTPSDYPYFTMGGSGDVFPDVFYSRIVADSNDEVNYQIQKMREYQSQSWSNNSGAKNAIGIASNEGWDPNDVEYIGQMLDPLLNSLGFSKTTFFQDNANSNVNDINSAFNKGARWFNYIGHGSGNSWSSITDGEYRSSDIKKLRPGAVKPVIIDVACQNGRFSYEGKLGERFMNESYRGQPTGAVAYYGGSVDISWDPPAIMAVAIGRNLAQQNTHTLFELIMKGQRYLIENYDDEEAAKENLRWYHLFGDPSLEVNNF